MTEAAPDDTPGAGPKQMGSEHQVQVSLLNALRDAIECSRPAPEIREILDQLADFSRVHFSSEQLLMRLCGYENFARHLSDHERALARLSLLCQPVA